MDIVRESGIIVAADMPSSDVEGSTKVPYTVCYPMYQFEGFMGDADTDEDMALDTGVSPELAREVATEVLEACGRVCASGCRLSDIVAAKNSPLDVTLDISSRDQSLLGIVETYMDTSFGQSLETDQAAEDVSATHVQNVVETWLEARYPKQEASTAEVTRPAIEYNSYRGLGSYANMNFHVIKSVVDRLVRIGMVQQVDGPEAAHEQFGASLEDPKAITPQDIKGFLLGLGKDSSVGLNLSSTPRSEIFG